MEVEERFPSSGLSARSLSWSPLALWWVIAWCTLLRTFIARHQLLSLPSVGPTCGCQPWWESEVVALLSAGAVSHLPRCVLRPRAACSANPQGRAAPHFVCWLLVLFPFLLADSPHRDVQNRDGVFPASHVARRDHGTQFWPMSFKQKCSVVALGNILEGQPVYTLFHFCPFFHPTGWNVGSMAGARAAT